LGQKITKVPSLRVPKVGVGKGEKGNAESLK